jgi:hypothetical protein
VYHAQRADMREPSELERHLVTVRSRLERLSTKGEPGGQPIEQRLASMADEYANYLKVCAVTVERHSRVVGELEAYAGQWRDASRQIREDTADRLQELVTTVERGWETLKRMQEEPIRELREQAAGLTQVRAAIATASQQDLERNARLASQDDIYLRLNELTIGLQSTLAEISARLARQPASQDASAQWPLDDVTRLHGQLREGVRDARDLPHSSAAETRQLVSPVEASEEAGRPFFEAIVGRRAFGSATGIPVKWAAAAILGLAIAATLAGVFGWRLQRQITAAEERQRLSDLKNQAMLDDTARQSETARLAAAKELAAAREMANRAQRVADVLAAPDLLRFSLSGADGASGQALVSRSRGFVVSGTRLPSPPANRAHHAWLLTRTTAVKMGPLGADPVGTVTLAQQMPVVPRAIVGVMVTEEPVNGGNTPSVATVLTSVRPAQSAAP